MKKKMITIVMCMVLVFVLLACGNKTTGTQSDSPEKGFEWGGDWTDRKDY